MIYHFVITVQYHRRWRRIRGVHTVSGHAQVPEFHSEKAVYERLLNQVVLSNNLDPARTSTLFYRLAEESASVEPVEKEMYNP